MKKFIFTLLIIIIAIPAIAKDPKETKEYWLSPTIKRENIEAEMNKCWNDIYAREYFIVPVGSKQWNICCAIRAAYDIYGRNLTVEQVTEEMIKMKQKYSK